jgi:mono/diheme cytochrome c family protein
MIARRIALILAIFAACITLACSSGGGSSEPAKLTPQQARGQKIFETQCAVCHAPGANTPVQGPNLAGVVKKGTLPSGMPATDANIKQTILQGRRMMPGFGNALNEDQLTVLVDYLHVK